MRTYCLTLAALVTAAASASWLWTACGGPNY